MLKVIPLLLILFFYCYGDTVYSTEYIYQIYEVEFDGGRDAGILFYFSSWSDASGVQYQNLNETVTISRTTDITLENCGVSDGDFLRKQDYFYGDRNEITIAMTSTGSITESVAENKDFTVSSEFQNSSEYIIENDVYPCSSNRIANSIIHLGSSPDFTVCSDVHYFFPDTVDNSDNDVIVNIGDTVEYIVFREGLYLDGYVSLKISLTYPTYHEAINDINRGSGTFSFTFYGTPDISSDSAEEIDNVYNGVLSTIGSFNDYPCYSNNYVSLPVSSTSLQINNESSDSSRIVVSIILSLLSVLFL